MRQESFPIWVRRFLLPVTVILLLLGVPYLLRPIAQVLLAVFTGVLLAIFLDGCTSLLLRVLPIRRGFALIIVLLLIFLIFAGLLWLAGAQMAEQATVLIDKLPAAVEAVRSLFRETPWVREMFSRLSKGGDVGSLLGNITTVFSFTLGAFANLVIIVFTGIYMALNPELYSRSLLRLLPPLRRPRGQEVLAELGQMMRYWLVGRLASMAVIGLLTTIGLLVIHQPLAFILGVIAGLLSFIPFLGPVLSAIPAILVGLTESPAMAGQVALVFLIVQFIESHLITPFIERRAVMMPPAFVLTGQFLMAVLLGFYGVLLATPLLVLSTILVQMLYIQDVLGDPVPILGDRNHEN